MGDLAPLLALAPALSEGRGSSSVRRLDTTGGSDARAPGLRQAVLRLAPRVARACHLSAGAPSLARREVR